MADNATIVTEKVHLFKKRFEGGIASPPKTEQKSTIRSTSRIQIPSIFVSSSNDIENARPFGRKLTSQSMSNLNNLNPEIDPLSKSKSQDNLQNESTDQEKLNPEVKGNHLFARKYKTVDNLSIVKENVSIGQKYFLDTPINIVTPKSPEVNAKKMPEFRSKNNDEIASERSSKNKDEYRAVSATIHEETKNKSEDCFEERQSDFKRRLNELKLKRQSSLITSIEESNLESKPSGEDLYRQKLKEIKSKRRSTNLDLPTTFVFNFARKNTNISKSQGNLSTARTEVSKENNIVDSKNVDFYKSLDDIKRKAMILETKTIEYEDLETNKWKRTAVMLDDTPTEKDETGKNQIQEKGIPKRIPKEMKEKYLSPRPTDDDQATLEHDEPIFDNTLENEIYLPVIKSHTVSEDDTGDKYIIDNDSLYINQSEISREIEERNKIKYSENKFAEPSLKITPRIESRGRFFSDSSITNYEDRLYINDRDLQEANKQESYLNNTTGASPRIASRNNKSNIEDSLFVNEREIKESPMFKARERMFSENSISSVEDNLYINERDLHTSSIDQNLQNNARVTSQVSPRLATTERMFSKNSTSSFEDNKPSNNSVSSKPTPTPTPRARSIPKKSEEDSPETIYVNDISPSPELYSNLMVSYDNLTGRTNSESSDTFYENSESIPKVIPRLVPRTVPRKPSTTSTNDTKKTPQVAPRNKKSTSSAEENEDNLYVNERDLRTEDDGESLYQNLIEY